MDSNPSGEPPEQQPIKTEGTEGPSGRPENSDDSDSYDSDDYDFPQDADTQTVTENYENELDDDLVKEAPAKRGPTRRSKIPAHLKGLMGEANLRFARGEYELAEKMCFEVIRQVPLAHEPYLTLAHIHENDKAKSIQYLTIAAHLNPQDADQWARLAQIHSDNGNLRKAVTCYTRAVHANSRTLNIDLQLKRIELLKRIGDEKYIRKCQQYLIHSYNPLTQSKEILETVKDLAASYHRDKEYKKASEIVAVVFEKCQKDITPEIVNIYLELLLLTKNFVNCLDLFVQYCNIEMEIVIRQDESLEVVSFNMPENLPIDLRIKFIICLIQMEAFQHLSQLLDPLLQEENVDHIGDLYLDVAENLMSVKRFEDALKLLVPLIKSDNFSLAAVWLKYAECQQACNMHEQAIESYYTVIRLAPQHHDVRFALADLLIQHDKHKEAVDVLTQDYTQDLHVQLLTKKIKLLREMDCFKEYIKSMEILLFRHCLDVKNTTEVNAVFLESTIDRINRIKKLRNLRGDLEQNSEIKSIGEIPVDEEYALFKDALKYCLEKKEYALLQKLSFVVLTSNRLKNYTKFLVHFALFACICNNDFANGYTIIRNLLLKNLGSIVHLNLWNLTLQRLDEFRTHSKFIIRQGKLLNQEHVKILEANNALCSGSYKIAMMILLPLLKDYPSPYMYLLAAVVFLQLSQQKLGTKKKMLIPTVYSLFLHYAKTRSKDAYQEVNYNLGRMYHKFGLLHLAANYYKLVLEYEDHLIKEHPDVLCLKREAAFNLSLIYKESDNVIGARNVLAKYVRI